MAEDPLHAKRVVAAGYDALAGVYDRWADRIHSGARAAFLSLLEAELPRRSAVLDLGCGSGVHATARLAERFNVTGVDISRRQLMLARAHVPRAALILADMARLAFRAGSFDGVAAFYSLTHLPPSQLAPMLESAADWLRPGGLLVASLGAGGHGDGVEDDWIGVPMYFGNPDRDTSLALVREGGLELVSLRDITEMEPEGPVPFLWIVARKPGSVPG